MAKEKTDQLTREKLADLLNEDLEREYQAVIAYVTYSKVLKGAAYMNIAAELEVHAKEELDHALALSDHVDYLGGMPAVVPKPVKTSEKAEDMLRFDLENEKETIRQYRRRIKQADELNEFAIAESLRGILGAGTGSPHSAGDGARYGRARPRYRGLRPIKSGSDAFKSDPTHNSPSSLPTTSRLKYNHGHHPNQNPYRDPRRIARRCGHSCGPPGS